MNHLALFLLIPAATLAWRWSRLVSGALWLTLATWLAYRGIRWQWPNVWLAGHLEWMRGVSMATGLAGTWTVRRYLDGARRVRKWNRAFQERKWEGAYAKMPDDAWRIAYLAALLVASMGVDLAALLIHRGTGQWGPQPVFQCIVLLAMGAVAWPGRKL
jgi:hypothetical protein